MTTTQVNQIQRDGGLRAGSFMPPACLPAVPPLRFKRRPRRRGRFLFYPEEKPRQVLFPKDGYSFLCKGGQC